MCKFLLFVATPRSLKSKDCQKEISLAQEHDIKIIPILGREMKWDDADLHRLLKKREYGFQLTDTPNIDEICDGIYSYICQYKREH